MGADSHLSLCRDICFLSPALLWRTEMEITLRNFLADYGQSLKQKVIDSFKPIYTASGKDTWDNEAELTLDGLKRKLFPAQSRAVLSLAKGFFCGQKARSDPGG